MKRVLVFLASVLSFFTLAMSCQQAPMLSVSGPRSYTFTRDGGSQSFTFTCNKDWSVSTTESWISVSPSSGSASDGETTVTLRCNPNTTYDPRTATLTIKVEDLAETITVNQETGIGLIVSPKTFDLTNAEQVIEIEVQENVQYSITIDDAGKSWITHTDTKGLSTEKAVFSIAANDTYDNREAKITFNQTDGPLSETVIIKQAQTDGLFITTPEYNLSNESHTLSVEVQANVSFEVTPEVEWIHYVQTKAHNSSTITLTIDANDTYDARTGKVIVKQSNGDLTGEITVNQAEKYGLFVSPEEFNLTKDEQTINVEVKYNVEYDVLIPDAAKVWVSIQTTPPTKGLATETVTFSIAENKAYVSREAAIAFKQKNGNLTGTVKITQEQTDYLSITPQRDSLSYEGGNIYLSVTTNIPFSLTIENDDDWVKIEESNNAGHSDGLITYGYSIRVSENESLNPRYSNLFIKDNSETMVQIFTLAQGGVPIIIFADNYVKKVCVEKFDTNADGEITVLEAKKVTSFPENFFGTYKDIVTSFEEFQYFNVEKTYHTFFSCSNLRKIVLPPSLKELGAMTFYGCTGLNSVLVPEGVDVFGDYVFAECSNLVSVTLPTHVTQWGECMFMDCTQLAQIELPLGIERLGTASFAMCRNLSEIVIPTGVISIGENAFRGCSGLEKVELPNSLLSIGDNSFALCSSLLDITLPDGLLTIGTQAFTQCVKLIRAYIPDTVIGIGNYVFDSCEALNTVHLSNSITEIPHAMFQNCYKLQNIVIPNKVRKISSYSFWACKSLAEISLPASILEICDGAFWACSELSTVYSLSSLPPILHNREPVFNAISPSAVLYVPAGCLDNYSDWIPFFNGGIKEMSF